MSARATCRPSVRPIVSPLTRNGVSGAIAGLQTIVFFNNTGQSNSQGTTGTGSEGITTTQENGAVGVTNGTYDGLASLTVNYFGREDVINAWYSENPIFGAIDFLYELIETENGKTWDAYPRKYLGSNNGLAGRTLARLAKGGDSGKFEAAIAQAGLVADIAANAEITPLFGMTLWIQGEADVGTAGYKAALEALIADYKTDGKAATGQTANPLFVTWQLCEAINSTTYVAPAQLEVSNEIADVYCTGPTYHLPKIDGTHLTPIGCKWMGAYFGLIYKRVAIDGGDFKPLQPSSLTINGNSIDITFNKSGLVFETDGDLPAQTNYGFTVEEADTTPVTISSVTIPSTNVVRVTCSTTPVAGWVVKYGHQAMSGIVAWTYTGPGGNLRDSAGDTLVYVGLSDKPMHNWCCLFREVLA